jgi:hypothetical protein
MKKNIVIAFIGIVFITMSCNTAVAQITEEVKKKTPELPGQIMVDFGFNLSSNTPYEMRNNWFRSKSLGIYFIKPYDISKNVSFRPGIGVAFEKFGHKDNPLTIDYVDNSVGIGSKVLGYDTIAGNIKKNQLSVSYIDIPIEIRVNFSGNEKKDGLYFALGGSAAFLFDSKTKMKFEDVDGRKRKEKVKSDFRITKIRMGAYARLGYRNVGLYYKIHFTDLFYNDGPPGTQDMRYSTIGVSITGF